MAKVDKVEKQDSKNENQLVKLKRVLTQKRKKQKKIY